MSATRVLVAMDGSENSAMALKCEYQTCLLYANTCIHDVCKTFLCKGQKSMAGARSNSNRHQTRHRKLGQIVIRFRYED